MDEVRVKADATAVGQQGLGIGGHLRRCMAADPDIRRPSIQMLAVRAGMGDGMVIGGGAVAAVHKNRGIKVGPHLFQQLHQLWGDEQGVGAVLAGKLPHPKMRAEFLRPFLRKRVGVGFCHQTFLSFMAAVNPPPDMSPGTR